ncbi:MAG: energy transducer TonB [Pyrinomonadaceae bacterium]
MTVADSFKIHFIFALAIVLPSGTVNAQDSDAKLISSPEFLLSAEAEAAGIDGNISVYVTIRKDGTVKSVGIWAGPAWPCGTSPKKELEAVRKAIKENVLKTKFQPAMKDGKAIEADVSFTFAIGEAYRKAQQQREIEEAIASGKPIPSVVKGGVLNGRAISLVRPPFPLAAEGHRKSGMATIEILIDESGKVIQAGAVGGWHGFHDESRKAACASRFSPTLIDGKPVKTIGVINYIFGSK